jgi:hypothetical protein
MRDWADATRAFGKKSSQQFLLSVTTSTVHAVRSLPIHNSDLLVILRGQLTVLRLRAEQGLPVSVESIALAENLARTLVLAGAT